MFFSLVLWASSHFVYLFAAHFADKSFTHRNGLKKYSTEKALKNFFNLTSRWYDAKMRLELTWKMDFIANSDLNNFLICIPHWEKKPLLQFHQKLFLLWAKRRFSKDKSLQTRAFFVAASRNSTFFTLKKLN